MNDHRMLIHSSVISIVIVVLGLFMLCMNRAPHLNLDEPLVEGGEDIYAEEAFNQDVLNLTELVDVGEGSGESFEASESEGDKMAEILRLLEIGNNEETNSPPPASNPTAKLVAMSTAPEAIATPASNESPEFLNESLFLQLEAEIASLEQLLKTKTTQIESLKTVIGSFEEKIASLEVEMKNIPQSTEKTYQPTISVVDNTATSDSNGGSSYFSEKYDEALANFNNRNYQLALQQFEALLRQNPNHSLSNNCQYWIGECQFALKNYPQAIVEFQKVFAFEDQDKNDDAQIMTALAYMRLGEKEMARKEFQQLLAYYGDSEYAGRAKSYLARL